MIVPVKTSTLPELASWYRHVCACVMWQCSRLWDVNTCCYGFDAIVALLEQSVAVVLVQQPIVSGQSACLWLLAYAVLEPSVGRKSTYRDQLGSCGTNRQSVYNMLA